MAILRLIVLSLLALVLAAGGPASAGNRIAVVVGNARYVNAPALRNPGNDASDIAEALKQLGFTVTLKLDATKRQLDQTIEQFTRDAKFADAALFFYAGHGMQYQGHNYLVPVDAELLDEVSLRYETTAVEEVKTALKASKGMKILVLDSCRDNPLAERLTRSLQLSTRDLPHMQGLARDEGTRGMIIVYSTQPDEVAHDGNDRNSPFSEALLKELKEPGLEVGALFRRVESDVYKATEGAQSPELSISMAPEYYLNQTETDQTVWSRIRGSADAPALREFIARFPKSFYAPDALARLDLIEAQAREQAQADKASATVREAAAEAERLKTRQAELDAAAAAARAVEQGRAAQLADAEKENSELRRKLAEATQQQAKDSDQARAKAAADRSDRAQREATLEAEIQRLQTSELEKQALAKRALEDERARLEAEEKAAQAAEQRAKDEAEARARADAEKVKAMAQHEAELAAEAAKARAEADAQARQAEDARRAAEKADKQVAAVTPTLTRSEPPPPDVVPLIRDQLRRLGCFSGGDLDWSAPALKLGLAKYVRYANLAAAPAPDQALLDGMRRRQDRLCPPECSVREVAIGGRCVAKSCPPGERLTRNGVCVRPPPPPIRSAVAVRPHRDEEAAPKPSGGRCFAFNGAQYCE